MDNGLLNLGGALLFVVIFLLETVDCCNDLTNVCEEVYDAAGNKTFTEQVLTNFCNMEALTFKTCVEGAWLTCTDKEEKAKLQGRIKWNDYRCNDGKQDFLRHQSCIDQVHPEHPRIENCGSNVKELDCSQWEKHLKCWKDVAEDICGSAAAAEFLVKRQRILTEDVREFHGCGSSGSGFVSTATVMLLLSVVVPLQWFSF